MEKFGTLRIYSSEQLEKGMSSITVLLMDFFFFLLLHVIYIFRENLKLGSAKCCEAISVGRLRPVLYLFILF